MSRNETVSKTLSYWLRHAPEDGNLRLDDAGWANTEAVLAAMSRLGHPGAAEDLARIVAESDKNRFELSPDGTRIRARQGHSIPVDAGWKPRPPPECLYHGTVERFLPSILAQGLLPKSRHHVHLSADLDTARQVGSRRGKAVILEIDAAGMASSGTTFLLSSNGVWLVPLVPVAHLRILDQH